MSKGYHNKEIKIKVKDFEENYSKIDSYEDHYDLLEDVKDYLVEYLDFSWGGGEETIGDNTDFEIKNGEIVVSVEYYDDSDNEDF